MFFKQFKCLGLILSYETCQLNQIKGKKVCFKYFSTSCKNSSYCWVCSLTKQMTRNSLKIIIRIINIVAISKQNSCYKTQRLQCSVLFDLHEDKCTLITLLVYALTIIHKYIFHNVFLITLPHNNIVASRLVQWHSFLIFVRTSCQSQS